MDLKYKRCEMLFGEEKLTKIQNAKILLLGVGGVGSFCLDCLYRTGVKDITIVDFDTYDETNQNRQIGSDKIGEVKVERLKKLYPNVTAINKKIDEQWVDEFDFEPYDLVLDAIDDFKAKIAIIKKCHKKLIMATGSAKKIDPTNIVVDNLWKTYGDAFARKIRNQLKKDKFSKRVLTIYSPEEAKTKEKGSFVAVTGAFGLTMCSKAIEIISSKD